MFREKFNFTLDVSSFISMLVLCFHFINGVIGVRGVSVVTISLIAFFELLVLLKKDTKINLRIFLLIIVVLFELIISSLRIAEASATFLYFRYFIAFSVFAMIAGSLKINVETTVTYILHIGFVGICIYLIRGFSNYDSSITMGISYSMLPVFFSSIIALLAYREKKIISMLCLFLCRFVFIKIAPRGLWLTSAFFIFFILLFRMSSSKGSWVGKIGRLSVLISAFIVIWLVWENFANIIIWLDSFFYNKFHISISAVKKMLFYLQKEELTNGRMRLWTIAQEYIMNEPVWGNGVGYFESLNEGAHSHNVFFQILCERGMILGGMIFFAVYGKGLYLLVKVRNTIKIDSDYYRIFVLSCGLIMLFFSSAYWLWVPFWYSIGYMLSNNDDNA